MAGYTPRATESSRIRDRLDHPVIDGDGHVIESRFVMPDFLKEVGGQSLVDGFNAEMAKARPGRPKPLFWPAHSGPGTLDRVTTMLPRLYAGRLDEAGVDFATIYPTLGFRTQVIPDEAVRRGACRALNMMVADMFKDVAHRMTPAACIPMHSPEEACEELEFAVNELGLKAAMIASEVLRPFPEVSRALPEYDEQVTRYTPIGLDADYDTFWAKCVALKVAPATHSINFTGTHASPSSYLYNRLGLFATAGYACCKALFLGGVTQRFPALNIAFLEGGVWWAAALYNDLFEFWEKRSVQALLARHDPRNVDTGLMAEMYERFGNGRYLTRERFLANREAFTRDGRGVPEDLPDFIDEWKHLRIDSAEALRDAFVENFHFGCEADDAMNYTAFNTRANRLGARLKAVFSSDLGHWDVVDFGDVLAEAHEAVERGLMTDDDFRDFVFTNPATFAARLNPDYFKGTVVEGAVDSLLAARAPAA